MWIVRHPAPTRSEYLDHKGAWGPLAKAKQYADIKDARALYERTHPGENDYRLFQIEPRPARETPDAIRRSITNARQGELIQADHMLQSWLYSIGAVEGPHGFDASPGNDWPIPTPEFILQTVVGVLTLHPSSSCGGSFECTTRFAEPARAAERIGRHNMNHYSGKWNFHGFDGDGWTPEKFAAYVIGEISRHMIK